MATGTGEDASRPITLLHELVSTGVDDAAPAAPLSDPPPLDDRKLRILRAIVTEYVADGEPVGSRRVVEVARLDVSAATVRNEMAALEELGYITQPHTSAGRVPTDQGYRRFVDDLATNPALDAPQRELIGELLGSARDVEDLLARTSSVLSQLTRLVSLVIAPAVDASRCKLVELVGLSPSTALLLLVADTGRVEKRTVELPAGTTETDLERLRTVLGEQVRGRPMGEVHAALTSLVEAAPSDLRELLRAITDATAAGLVDDTVHHVVVGGRASLADEAALERDELSRVLQLLEERATLARLLADTTDDAPLVRIGGENAVEDLRSTSLVAQRYRVVTAGSLGVLGPTRMDYASVLSTVRAVAEELQRSLADLSG
ncbi:MAG: heat-inducible transcriptional repressor HrcA [Nitriliruptor sp.]